MLTFFWTVSILEGPNYFLITDAEFLLLLVVIHYAGCYVANEECQACWMGTVAQHYDLAVMVDCADLCILISSYHTPLLVIEFNISCDSTGEVGTLKIDSTLNAFT